MRFPKTATFLLQTERDYELFLAGLRAAGAILTSPENEAFGLLVDKLILSDGSGQTTGLPEAYLEIDGQRLAEGRRADLEKRFDMEAASHRARLVLYAREPASASYRPIKSRRPQNTGGPG